MLCTKLSSNKLTAIHSIKHVESWPLWVSSDDRLNLPKGVNIVLNWFAVVAKSKDNLHWTEVIPAQTSRKQLWFCYSLTQTMVRTDFSVWLPSSPPRCHGRLWSVPESAILHLARVITRYINMLHARTRACLRDLWNIYLVMSIESSKTYIGTYDNANKD